MPSPDKVTDVAELTENFRTSAAAVLTEYRGLTVSQLTQLRHNLGTTTQYTVVENTLSKIAVREAGLQELESMLSGPSAIAFIKGDAVLAAKSLRDFAKANPFLVIKGGVLDGKLVTAAELSKNLGQFGGGHELAVEHPTLDHQERVGLGEVAQA